MAKGLDPNKFIVKRSDGSSEPGKKHEHCQYFVLDLNHDPYAISALHTYAEVCEKEHPELAKDLFAKVKELVTNFDDGEPALDGFSLPSEFDIAPGDRVDAEMGSGPEIMIILNAVGHPEAFISDESMLSDFFVNDDEGQKIAMEKISKELNIEVNDPLEYIVNISARARSKRTGLN